MPRQADDTAALLLDVTMQLMKRLSAHMRQSNRHLGPVHAGMLMKIGEEPCTISDLARHQCTRLPTVSRSVGLLVDRGLVERWIPETNRRTTMVRLTGHGRRVVNEMMRDVHAHTESILEPLTGAEKRKVRAALSLLAGTIAAPAETFEPVPAAGTERSGSI